MNNSQEHLVSLAIGPVQDFIAAALRTRDLWFGSNMLSEVSKAAARGMRNTNAELIFPFVTNDNDLKHDSDINVANRIVAIVKGDAKTVLDAGKQAAKDQLEQYIKQAGELYTKKIGSSFLLEDVWNRQAKTSDLLELYATSVPIKNNDYLAARKRLDRLTAARKNTREFYQPTINPKEPGFTLFKSSLDGRRETVLADELSDKQRRILRMGKNEQLDLMGLVKRLAGEKVEQFTPTTRIAVDPWIHKITKAESENGGDTLDKLGNVLEKLVDSGFVTRVSGNNGIYAGLPYDSGLLYQDRLQVAIRECKKENLENLQLLKKILGPVWEQYGQPDPYYVLMMADGDRMGTLLDKGKKKEDHQEISRLLAEFTQSVRAIVQAKAHRGHCIYAGGDDVFAMVPVNGALALADELRKVFHDKLKGIAGKLGVREPTLSAGLAMVHMQTPLGRVRRLAAQAEKLAKGSETDTPRNALGIIVASRSGAPLELRLPWEKDPLTQLGSLVSLYQTGNLSTRFGYELREVALLLQGMGESTVEKMKKHELNRILGKKNVTGGSRTVSEETKNTVLNHAEDKKFDAVFNEHLIARWLGVHAGEITP